MFLKFQNKYLTSLFRKLHYEYFNPFLSYNLSEKEKSLVKSVRKFCRDDLMNRIVEENRVEKFDKDIFQKLGQLNVLGASINGFGCSGISFLAVGLISMELEAVDSAYRSCWSEQSLLVMQTIYNFGSEEQKEMYIPSLRKGNLIGCFALTESNHGSNPAKLETTYEFDESNDCYIITGEKSWISSAPVSDIFIVWAKNTKDGKIGGFVLHKNLLGVHVEKIEGKLALRAITTGNIKLNNVKVSSTEKLPSAIGLKSAYKCLNYARYGISWGVLGAARFCFNYSRDYAVKRYQFGKSLASTQSIQIKLADMYTDLCLAELACYSASSLLHDDELPHEAISLLKRNNCNKAFEIVQRCRDILGANGILGQNHILRHFVNLEAIKTYGGTPDIHGLILGQAITGFPAF